jgi:O-antigen/teichoic acid export membrane protein
MLTRKHQTIASGASAAFVGQLLSYGLALLGTLVVSRALGPAGRGEMAVAITAAGSFFAITHLSVDLSATYFFARRLLALRTIARVMSSLALLAGPVALLLQLAFFLAARDSVFGGIATAPILLAAATVPISIHLAWMLVLFQLGEHLSWSQTALVTSAALQLAGVITLALLGDLTVGTAVGVYAVQIGCSWVLHLIAGRSFLSLAPSRDRPVIREVARYALRLHPGYLFWFLLLRVDVLFVNGVLGTREAGLYAVAVIIAEVVLLLANPITAAVLPVQSMQETPAAAALTFKAVRLNLLLATALSLSLAATMWILIPLVFGASFTPAYTAVLSLLPGVVAMAGYRPLYNLLLRQDRAQRLTALSGAAFATNIVLNLMLLHPLGIVGAGVASSLSYIALTGCFVAWGLSAGKLTLRQALLPRRGDLESIRRQARLLLRRPAR